MCDKISLQWTYTPKDYFEQQFITQDDDGIVITIDNGVVMAELNGSLYDSNPDIRQQLERKIRAMFEGVLIQSHGDFSLIGCIMRRKRPDGKVLTTSFPEPASFGMSARIGGVIISNKDGNIILDTRKNRIQQKQQFATTISAVRGQDEVLDFMIDSYINSVRDSSNELIHLYDIKDAISTKYGGEDEARKRLNFNKNTWSELGRLSNYEPLSQGRHRGKYPSRLRKANASELETARQVAQKIIMSYIEILNSSPS